MEMNRVEGPFGWTDDMPENQIRLCMRLGLIEHRSTALHRNGDVIRNFGPRNGVKFTLRGDPARIGTTTEEQWRM